MVGFSCFGIFFIAAGIAATSLLLFITDSTLPRYQVMRRDFQFFCLHQRIRMTEGWFLTGSVAGHVVEMTPTEAICLTFVFLVDAASLICN